MSHKRKGVAMAVSRGMVSVIIPAYNRQKFISSAIESCMRQTYENIEVIVVDDGSTDGTVGRVESYAKKDGRIRLIEKENGGVSSARNLGAKSARGEYIFFLDSDDLLMKRGLESLVSAMEGVDFCIGDCREFYYFPWLSVRNRNIINRNVGWDESQLDIAHFITYGVRLGTIMYRRKIFDKLALPIHLKFNEDSFFNQEVFINYVGRVIREDISRIRNHYGNKSRRVENLDKIRSAHVKTVEYFSKYSDFMSRLGVDSYSKKLSEAKEISQAALVRPFYARNLLTWAMYVLYRKVKD